MENTNANANANKGVYAKEECPLCHFIFVIGYNAENVRQCPSCRGKYLVGQKPNHDKDCLVCLNRLTRGYKDDDSAEGSPPLMSDGRFITNYNSTNELTETMRKINGVKSPNDFRIFMQNNGELFMNAERNYFTNKYANPSHVACSEGWYDLWAKKNGNWANLA